MTELELAAFEDAAFQNASSDIQSYYQNTKQMTGGRFFEEARTQLFYDEIMRRENAAGETG